MPRARPRMSSPGCASSSLTSTRAMRDPRIAESGVTVGRNYGNLEPGELAQARSACQPRAPGAPPAGGRDLTRPAAAGARRYARGAMKATEARIRCRGPLDARVRVPGSKSETNRALLIAALARGRSELSGALDS